MRLKKESDSSSQVLQEAIPDGWIVTWQKSNLASVNQRTAFPTFFSASDEALLLLGGLVFSLLVSNF